MYVFSRPPAPLRCCGVWLLVTAAVATPAPVVVEALMTPLHAARPAGFTDLLVAACAAAALMAAAWLWLVATDVAVRAALGRRPVVGTRRPGALRLLLVAACGAAVLGAPSAGAAGPDPAADERGSRSDDARGRDGQELLAGLPLPDRATGGARRAPAPPPTYRVRPGDSLWTIAADRLGPAATAAEITAYWHRVHSANPVVIGADPDLIHPGQHLVLPHPLRPDPQEPR